MDPLLLHVAFVCDDIPATLERLMKAGAKLDSPLQTIPSGDQIAILRDPWSLPIQLARRQNPMVP
jgi:glyoxylase I family protein